MQCLSASITHIPLTKWCAKADFKVSVHLLFPCHDASAACADTLHSPAKHGSDRPPLSMAAAPRRLALTSPQVTNTHITPSRQTNGMRHDTSHGVCCEGVKHGQAVRRVSIGTSGPTAVVAPQCVAVHVCQLYCNTGQHCPAVRGGYCMRMPTMPCGEAIHCVLQPDRCLQQHLQQAQRL